MFPIAILNWTAILLAAIVAYAIGTLWFSPALFGRAWMKAMGWNMKDVEKEMKKTNQMKMAKSYFIMFLGTLIMSFVLSILIHVFGATSLSDASIIGVLVWVGFIATSKISDVLFEGKNFEYYAITVMHSFVVILVMCWILAAWF
jgi:hypothetical protein